MDHEEYHGAVSVNGIYSYNLHIHSSFDAEDMDRDTAQIKVELAYKTFPIDRGWKMLLLETLKSHENNKETFKPLFLDVNFDSIYLVWFVIINIKSVC